MAGKRQSSAASAATPRAGAARFPEQATGRTPDCHMRLRRGLDTGPILPQDSTPPSSQRMGCSRSLPLAWASSNATPQPEIVHSNAATTAAIRQRPTATPPQSVRARQARMQLGPGTPGLKSQLSSPGMSALQAPARQALRTIPLPQGPGGRHATGWGGPRTRPRDRHPPARVQSRYGRMRAAAEGARAGTTRWLSREHAGSTPGRRKRPATPSILDTRGSGRMEPAPPGARPLLPCRYVAEQCSADRPKPCDPARRAHLRERGGRDRALPKLGEHRVQRPPQLGLQHAPRLGRPAACTRTLQGRHTTASPDRRPASHTATGHACERGGSRQVHASRGEHRKGGMPSCSLASSAITGGGSTSGRMDSTCARRASVAAKAVTADRMRHAPPHLLLSGSGLVRVQTRNQVSSAGGDREGQGGLHGTHACCAGWDTQTAVARPASRQGAASLAAPNMARRRAHAERGGAPGRRAPGPA